MFGFGRKTPAATQPSPTSHAVQMQVREELIGAQAREIEELKRTNYALDRKAARFERERDELQAQLAPFLARREKAKQNLRQYRKPASNGVAAH